MKIISWYYRILTTFSILLGITVILDTFILKQFLKKLMVQANTSSISPYNTDGVANIIIILFLLIALPFLMWLLRTRVEKDEP